MKISALIPLEKNPFKSKGDEQIRQIADSIQNFEKMMAIRPIIYDEQNVILGGNKRFFALKMLDYKDIPETWAKQVLDLTEDEKLEFIVKDNSHWGSVWDYDLLTEWNVDLSEWGVDVPVFEVNEHEKFEPIITPETSYSDITREQIQKEAERLATQMIKDRAKIECICPECGTEFEIDR